MADVTIGYGVSADSVFGVKLNGRLSITFLDEPNSTPQLDLRVGVTTDGPIVGSAQFDAARYQGNRTDVEVGRRGRVPSIGAQ